MVVEMRSGHNVATMVPMEVHDITRENLPRVLEKIILPLFS